MSHDSLLFTSIRLRSVDIFAKMVARDVNRHKTTDANGLTVFDEGYWKMEIACPKTARVCHKLHPVIDSYTSNQLVRTFVFKSY
ncbi:hypothetical protein PSSHI_37460 [Photobacterium sp. R1]